MIKYRTGSVIGSKLIEAVEVERETESSVWVKSTWNGKEQVNRELKRTGYHNYFDTWEEARLFLMEKEMAEISLLRGRIKYHSDNLVNIKGLKKPE